jgi:hypothetical protein
LESNPKRGPGLAQYFWNNNIDRIGKVGYSIVPTKGKSLEDGYSLFQVLYYPTECFSGN